MLLVLLLSLAPVQPAERVIVIADANAREKPTTESRVLCPLGMGQELTLQGREGDWVIVETCGGGAYVHAPLTRTITPESRARVREEIVRERLARQADSFSVADKLLPLIAAWQRDAPDRDAEGRYALYELQALKRAADAAHGIGAVRGNLMRRIGEMSPVMLYSEIGGRWMLRNQHIFTVHDEYKDTAAADDIAWFAAENGLPGECEGYMPCYLSAAGKLQAEYLRRYPRGRHAGAAVARILEVAGFAGDPPTLDPGAVTKTEVCGDMRKPLGEVRAAVAGAAAPRKAEALSALDRLAAPCR